MAPQQLQIEASINRVRAVLLLLLLGLSSLSRWQWGPEHQATFVLESLVGGAALGYCLLIAWLCKRGAGGWLRYFAVTADFALIASIIASHTYGDARILGTMEFYHGLLDTVFLLVFVENALGALRQDRGIAIYCAVLGGGLTLGIGLYSAYALGIPGTLVDSLMRLAFVVATALIPIAGLGAKSAG